MSMAHTKTNTKTNTQTKTNTKCFKDPMYVIFLRSREFKDFKYDMDIDMADMDMVDIVMYFLSSIASSYIPSGTK